MNPGLSLTPFGGLDSLKLDLLGVGFIIVSGLVISFVTGFVGAFIGNFRNRKSMGLFLGIVLGPVGWLIALFLKRGEREETFFDGLAAYVAGNLFTMGFSFLMWKLYTRPILERVVVARQATEQRRVEVEKERQAAEERAEKQHEQESLVEEKVEPQEPAALAPLAPIATPRPRSVATPIPTPDPAKVREEILRKYGKPQ